MKFEKQFLFVLVATSLVLGCGYKLRAWDLSKNIDSIFVQSKTNSPIDDSLSLALGRAGVLLVENPKDADVVVSLGNYTRSRRTASVNRRASAADYQLSLQISYEVLKGGKRILGPQIARAYRVYRVDRENTNVDSVYAEAGKGEIRFLIFFLLSYLSLRRNFIGKIG